MDTPMSAAIAVIKGMGKSVIEKRSGDWHYLAQCSAHDDKTPSLRIGQDSQGILRLKCFAGCDTDAILKSLGMTKGDMVPQHMRDQYKQAKKKNYRFMHRRKFRTKKKTSAGFPKKPKPNKQGKLF